MPVQAIPLALTASLYPFGLAVLLLLAEAERYKGRVTVFLAGAAICTLAIGFAVVFALHGAGLGQQSQQSPRYGLRLGLGVAFVVVAVILARRPPKPKKEGESRVTRAARQGGLIAALIAGIVLYLPSPTYLSALQVVGSSKLSTAATAAWVVIVVAITLITIWVPTLVIVLAPGWSKPKLAALNSWLSRNSRTLLVVVLAVLGIWQIIDGIVGLA
jgi:Sap-like sulfolipid-1-addressing protein